MKQVDLDLDLNLNLNLNLNLSTNKTRKGKFLDEMERVVPWTALV